LPACRGALVRFTDDLVSEDDRDLLLGRRPRDRLETRLLRRIGIDCIDVALKPAH
jgi:hypothetical protein